MSEDGRNKLREYGIAPPQPASMPTATGQGSMRSGVEKKTL